jgi:hypothetical protein
MNSDARSKYPMNMKTAVSYGLLVAVLVLVGCSNATPSQSALPSNGVVPNSVILRSARSARLEGRTTSALTELYNLDYSNGTITVFSIQGHKAKVATQFTPGSASGGAQGLAADAHGNIYTTLTESGGSPCSACVQIYTDAGKLVRQLDAPTLSGAPGAPDLTDVSVDAHDNVYVSDYGQQAVYYFPHGKMTKNGPTIVVQDSQNAASVLSQPNGKVVLISGGCGFASVAPFTKVSRGKYTQGSCFGIGTIALIGGALDDQEEVMTPVDGVPGLVSVSSPSGGKSIRVPDMLGSISGIAFNSDASVAYVADAHKEVVYAFAQPANGWLSKGKPKLVATYKGFTDLDIIAIPQ